MAEYFCDRCSTTYTTWKGKPLLPDQPYRCPKCRSTLLETERLEKDGPKNIDEKRAAELLERQIRTLALHSVIRATGALLKHGANPGDIHGAYKTLEEIDMVTFGEWSPLMVALAKKAGIKVRCPVEVDLVAEDVALSFETGVVPDWKGRKDG